MLNQQQEEDITELITPCKHTLFIAHDIGFEYRSEQFNENLGIENKDDDEITGDEFGGYDGLTDKVSIISRSNFEHSSLRQPSSVKIISISCPNIWGSTLYPPHLLNHQLQFFLVSSYKQTIPINLDCPTERRRCQR